MWRPEWERVWGRMDYMYRILESLHCSPETITTLFIVYVLVLCLVAQPSPTLCNPMDCSLPGTSVHGDSPGKNTGVGYHALLQEIFPTQWSNPSLSHYRHILYHLSHQGSPLFMWEESYSMSLWLVYFTQHNILKVHLCCNMFQNFLPFKADNIPFMYIANFVYPFIG